MLSSRIRYFHRSGLKPARWRAVRACTCSIVKYFRFDEKERGTCRCSRRAGAVKLSGKGRKGDGKSDLLRICLTFRNFLTHSVILVR